MSFFGVTSPSGEGQGVSLAGHRQCGIQYLSPVAGRFGTGKGHIEPVPNWFQHRHSVSFRFRPERTPDSPAFRQLQKTVPRWEGIHSARLNCWWWKEILPARSQTAGGGEGYTLHVHTRLLLVLYLLWCWKIIYTGICRNAEKFVSLASAVLLGPYRTAGLG
jgi:hypothetical protein